MVISAWTRSRSTRVKRMPRWPGSRPWLRWLKSSTVREKDSGSLMIGHCPELPELASEPPNSPVRSRCRALHEALTGWMEVVDPQRTRVLNRAGAMASNFSKPYQAQLIARYGFLVPETLVTNDPDLVRAFRAMHGGVIYKSISGIRSIVRALEDTELSRLDAICWCPTQFQAFVPGVNVRVHVIGAEVLATAAVTEATDYRYAHRDDLPVMLRPHKLPDDVRARCVALTEALGLVFAGLDLKITPDGRVYCFEVNPSPAFPYYETATGQPIAAAVASCLLGVSS